jgi:hypothetical protein
MSYEHGDSVIFLSDFFHNSYLHIKSGATAKRNNQNRPYCVFFVDDELSPPNPSIQLPFLLT